MQTAGIGTDTKGRIFSIMRMKEKEFVSTRRMTKDIFGIQFKDTRNKPMFGSFNEFTRTILPVYLIPWKAMISQFVVIKGN
jgi:hypothetical protein